jgi:hypothetical protein
MRSILLLFLAVGFLPAAAPAQDPVELDRLAGDQRQVAEQVRRLDKLLLRLEERDRADGLESRAELIAGARVKLRNVAESDGDLAAALEAVAAELGRMQTGAALEAQAEAIALLQDLLDFLVTSERRALDRQRIQDLEEWREGLEKLAAAQQELLDKSEALEEREKIEGSVDEAAREELAREQQELADAIEEFNDEQAREGMRSENTERAEQRAEDAAESLQPPPSAEQQGERPMEEAQRSMDEAQEQQQEARDSLEQQQQDIDQEMERRENEALRQALLDVKEEAEKLLERHRVVREALAEVLAEADGGRLPRSARGRLRQASSEERSIAEEAGVLLLTIDEFGADSFPYFISQLREDHDRLASQVGPPRYRLQEGALQLADELAAGWTDLIEAIRIEEERLRRRMDEQPEGGQPESQPGEEEEEESPLVQFTAELQLLKRMQATLTGQLERLRDRLAVYESAGLAADPLDVAELQLLQERQSELALKFESILQRALGTDEEGGEEEDA